MQQSTETLGRSLVVAFLIGLILNSFQSASADDSSKSRGWSDTKPASGRYVEVGGRFMVPYTETIEGTEISFEMIPIPGGTIKIGSPESEAGRSESEGPQFAVTLEPFWMAKTELTWGEYNTFMKTYEIFKRLSRSGVRKVTASNRADAITVPTPLYEPSHTFKFGDDPAQPAVTMTQYAAKQYTKWLSGLTTVQYRLPTEAEWEYAARAGSEAAFCFGDDPAMLDQYANFSGNSTSGAAKVASKAPNAFGLHDMHGNVWEWTVDQFDESGYGERGGKTLKGLDAVAWPQTADMRCVRGGGWQDGPERVRSAIRMGSNDEDWKEEDPNVPLSPWWYTSDPARMVGMRLVRSATDMDAATIAKFWEIDNTNIQEDVDFRLKEGRGVLGISLPELAKEFQKKKKR